MNLGKFQSRLYDLIKGKESGSTEDFPVIITHEKERPNSFIVGPERLRFRNFSGYKIHLPSCSIIIKVDSRPLPVELARFSLNSKQDEFEVLIDDRKNKLFDKNYREFFLKNSKKNGVM